MNQIKSNFRINLKAIIILLITVFTTGIILFFFDYISYCTYPKMENKTKSIKNYLYTYKDKTEEEIENKFIYDRDERKFRKIENINSKKDSVVIFGFSGIYGLNLKENETISYYLGKMTDRPVYNRAKAESSLNHMYYQLSHDDFYKIVPKAKYVIYFYNPKQLYLMNNKLDFCQHDIYYKLSKNKLVRYNKIPLLKKAYLMARINIFLFRKGFLNDFYYKKDGKILKAILNESKKEVQKHWGEDTEYIIVRIYDEKNKSCDKIFKDLENSGFKIIKLYKKLDTSSKKYAEENSYRPNKRLWEESAEVLIKELNHYEN